MPRPRATSTVTHGTLKFRPVFDRGTKADGAGRALYYWRCDEYQGREQGKPVRRAYPSLWAAQEDLAQVAARYARGETEAAPEGRATVDEFRETATAGMILQAWLTAKLEEGGTALGDSTRDVYRRWITATKELSFRRHRAANVGKPELDALAADLRRDFAVSTTIGILGAVAAAWRWAYERAYVPRPLSIRPQVTALRKLANRDPSAAGERDKRTPTVEEAQAVGRWFLDEDPGRGRWPTVAYFVLLSTGCRIGEVAALRWGDIRVPEADGGAGSIFVPKSKTGPRTVYVGGDVLRQIVALRPETAAETDPLLQSSAPGGWAAVTPGTAEMMILRCLERACEALGIPRFTPHGLRRLAVRQAVRFCMKNGGSISAAAKQMGHTVPVMLKHYEAATVEEQRQAAAGMDYALIPPVKEANVVPMRSRPGK